MNTLVLNSAIKGEHIKPLINNAMAKIPQINVTVKIAWWVIPVLKIQVELLKAFSKVFKRLDFGEGVFSKMVQRNKRGKVIFWIVWISPAVKIA